jgi:cell division protein ZapA
MAQVNLTVNGRVYRMACEDGEEDHVIDLGARFDQAIVELRSALGEIGDQRLIVMAGILMTDRLDDAERRLKQAEQGIRELKEHRLDAASRYDGLEERYAAALSQAAARIESLAERLSGGAEPEEDEGR